MWVGAAFLFLLLLEHIGMHCSDHCKGQRINVAMFAIMILAIHSFLAGIALGMSADLKTFVVVTIAILSHKWAAGFALAMMLAKSSLTSKACWFWYLFFAVMTPLGILVGSILLPWHHGELSMIATAVAAGTFLYVGTLHGLKRAILVDRCCDLKTFIWVLVGFAMMAIVG